ncbi:hypothetical protein ACJX0J_038950, partial [Zea mays]
ILDLSLFYIIANCMLPAGERTTCYCTSLIIAENISTYFAYEHFIYEGILHELLIGKQKGLMSSPRAMDLSEDLSAKIKKTKDNKYHIKPHMRTQEYIRFLFAVCDKIQCPIVSACVPFSELTNFIITLWSN